MKFRKFHATNFFSKKSAVTQIEVVVKAPHGSSISLGEILLPIKCAAGFIYLLFQRKESKTEV